MKKAKKTLSVLLACVLTVISLILPAVTAYAEPETTGSEVQLEMEDLDPSTLHVPKLVETEEGEEEPVEEITPPYAFNEQVRVSVFLDAPGAADAGYSIKGIGTNAAAATYRQQLKAQQDALVSKIESVTGHTADVKWNLTLSTNAVSMNVRYADIVKIGSLDGVKKVVIEKQYEAPAAESGTNDPNTANTSENMVGATIAWADGYTGAGSRIAIIDTGIDTTHQSFAAQTYFEYRTDMPANRDLTDEQLAKGTQDIGELTSVYSFEETDSATAGFVGKSLLLGNEIGIKYYMDLSNVPVKDNIRAEFTYITATGIESLAVFRFDEFEYNQSQNAYVVRLKTIAAKDAGQPVEARIIDGDTLISGVLTYSIESYAKSTLEDSSDERLRAVVTEMMKYCKSAEAYLVQ